jgi:aminoglycoside 6'-N-acetyltransferase
VPDRPQLRGDHVLLRPLRRDDVERVAEIQREPGVARWWGAPDVAELEEKAAGRDEAVAFAVEADGEVVGLVQYYEKKDPDFRHAGIDIFVREASQRRGLGTDAVRTLARHLVGDRGHHRLIIDPAAANGAAVRAFEKVGFRRVGVMRRYWRAPDGIWQDGLLMDLLAEEL